MLASPEPISLVLASASPRRKQILRLLGAPFRTAAAGVDESPQPAESPPDLVRRLAQAKALAVARRNPDVVVLAADTVVVFEGAVIGKPADAEEASVILHRLRGRSHSVCTGVAVMQGGDDAGRVEVVETRVTMRAYTSGEIVDYVSSGDPLDKAAAYAIQHPSFRPVERIVGCPASVMGLPLCTVSQMLSQLGIAVPSRSARNCDPGSGRCGVASLLFRLPGDGQPPA